MLLANSLLSQPQPGPDPAASAAGFAAQSILAALGSVQFVSNVIFAWLVLQEKVMVAAARLGAPALAPSSACTQSRASHLLAAVQATRRVCAATGCIVLGCIILVTFGNHQSTTLTVQDMLKYYERCGHPALLIATFPAKRVLSCLCWRSPVYISYLVVMGVTVVGMLLVYRRGSQKLA